MSDSQHLILRNVNELWKELTARDDDTRKDLGEFVIQQCYLVVVTATDRDSAYRIFSVMNDRGLDLSPTDILKAETIGRLREDEQDDYGRKWEEIEEDLGRESFRDLFAHIRMINLKTKLRSTLQADFQQKILPNTEAAAFVDEMLEPYANVYQMVAKAAYKSNRGAAEINGYLRHLGRLDNFDWLPPAMEFFRRREGDQEQILKFTKDLERLAYGLFISRANINQRINRYADVLRAIQRDEDLFDEGAAMDLNHEEKDEILEKLNGPIYSPWSRVVRPLLLRLNSALVEPGATYDDSFVSIEHVLPQNPKVGSEWLRWFQEEGERVYWTHRLANLVLLSGRKNARASNLEFERKKREYFLRGGSSPFALTMEVVGEQRWMPEVLEERQARLLGRLKREWRLG